MRVSFERRDPTTVSVLGGLSELRNCVALRRDRFGRFVRDVLNDLKGNKCAYYNSVLGQLITIHQEAGVRNEYTDLLARVILADNVVITDIEESVFLKKLKINKHTDDINYLILPNFTLWDHGFLVFLNKKFNSKKAGGLINVWGAMQKIPLTQGIIKDLIQNKNGYAGQYLYSTFLNTSSFYANVKCFNGLNEIIPPTMSVARYYGRPVDNVRVWNTRHPNISQLSTQYSRVLDVAPPDNWNMAVGLGTFVGAHRDCDGDREVITYPPKPNSLIDLESLLYCDPVYSFICFDKNKLSFVSQQVFYLYRRMADVERELRPYPEVLGLWLADAGLKLSARLEALFSNVTLLFSSNMATLLFRRLCEVIDADEMVCDRDEVKGLSGSFCDIVDSGAKGSRSLIENTRRYGDTGPEDVNLVSERAIEGLNSHITSHGNVKHSGGDLYHNTVVFLNMYIKGLPSGRGQMSVCYKKDDLVLGELCNLPSEFLVPTHLLDLVL